MTAFPGRASSPRRSNDWEQTCLSSSGMIGRSFRALMSIPDPEFVAFCERKQVEASDSTDLWNLYRSWRWSADEPAARLDELFADYEQWQLFRRSRDGDAMAARRFERRWSSYIKALLAWRTKPEELDEYRAIFFERVYRLIAPRYHWRTPFTVYLRTILLNVVRTHGARHTKRRAREQSLESEPDRRAVEPASPAPGPEAHVLHDELRRQLTEALSQLPPLDRFIVVQSLVEGVAARDLAAKLGISRDAVLKRSQRARKKLRKLLETRGLTVHAAVLAGLS